MCCRRDDRGWYFDEETVQNTIELVRMLMDLYSIPADRVVLHYDVKGKICPEPFVRDGDRWAAFLSALTGVVQGPAEQPDLPFARGMIAKVQQTLNQVYGYHLAVDNSPGPDTRRHLIMALQSELNWQYRKGLAVDGSFGPGMESAVRKYQANHGLTVDGIAGRDTQTSLFR